MGSGNGGIEKTRTTRNRGVKEFEEEQRRRHGLVANWGLSYCILYVGSPAGEWPLEQEWESAG